MNKCKRCGVHVADDSTVCPLCDTVLYGGAQTGEDVSASYPDVGVKTRKLIRISQIAMYFALLIEVGLVIINYYTYSHTHTWWSAISGGAIIYLIFTVRDILNKRAGHIRKIYMQVIGLIALIVCIDMTLGFSGWSLEYGLPCVILGIDLTIILCMIINYANWQNYLIMQIFTVLLSVLDMVFYLTGIVEGMILPWVSLGVSVILWTGTLIIGDRKATNELKRKFHL